MSKHISFQLRCQLTGLQIGTLEYDTVAGHAPWFSHWNGMQARHPMFSLPRVKLLAFARSGWNRLAKASADGETTEKEDTILRVAFLAVLHSLGSVKQTLPGLPAIHIVQNNMNRLFALAYWHHYLDSKRFGFPEYRVSKINANADFLYVGDYLDVCFAIKEDYEKGINDLEEQERAQAAERALKQLRNSWVVPVSNKQLWKWVLANLPERYKADAMGWMGTIFCGTERSILAFDKDEHQLMQDIVLSNCPIGTGVMKAVETRLNAIMTIYNDHKEAFSVDLSSYAEPDDAPKTVLVAPKRSDFVTLGEFIKANATYYLQQRARDSKKDQL